MMPKSVRWTVDTPDGLSLIVIQFAQIRISREMDGHTIVSERISGDTLAAGEVMAVRAGGGRVFAFDGAGQPIAASGFWSEDQLIAHLS